MSHTDMLNAAIRRIRRAAKDCPAEAWDWIDIALAEIERAYIGRSSEMLAANNAEVERRRAAENRLADISAVVEAAMAAGERVPTAALRRMLVSEEPPA